MDSISVCGILSATLCRLLLKKNRGYSFKQSFTEFVGPTSITQNAGEVENKGFDISLSTVLFEKDDFSINSDFNLSANKNKVVKLVDGVNSMVLKCILRFYLSSKSTRVEVGQPISTFRSYHFDGVYQTGATDGPRAMQNIVTLTVITILPLRT